MNIPILYEDGEALGELEGLSLGDFEGLSLGLALGERLPGELVAFEIRSALEALGEIVGETTPEDVLDRIFDSFCIGK